MATPDPTAGRQNPGASMDNGIDSTSDKSLMNQVRSTAADAYGTATSKAAEKLEEQKSTLTSSLTSVADNIRKLGKNFGDEGAEGGLAKSAATYGDTAADKIEQAAKYFEKHDVEAIYHDVEDLARQNPAIFVGGAFALGFLAARFLKSTSSRSRSLSGSHGARSLNRGSGTPVTKGTQNTAPGAHTPGSRY